jgi:hypothetical protein
LHYIIHFRLVGSRSGSSGGIPVCFGVLRERNIISYRVYGLAAGMGKMAYTFRHTGAAVVAALVVLACNSDALRRTGFEAVQSAGEQQCRQVPNSECPERQRYEDYDQQREALAR